MRIHRRVSCLMVVAGLLPLVAAGAGVERYALILTDPPVARLHQRTELQSAAAIGHRQNIRAAQANLRSELERRGFVVRGAVQNVLNAVFVEASKDRVAELQALPGVKAVVHVRKLHLLLNAAVNLVNAPGAWSAVGGVQNAGLGIKIGMIDTGIDQTHPAFHDASLPVPAGFPKCNVAAYCAFTNNKVIVARSYVSQPGPVDPTQSHPDDPTPRDRVGHGTATAMVAAGETNAGPSATITGMAPKAYLGNYKVFGSTFNPFATDQEIVQAMDDALTDGMDIVSMSLGAAATGSPTDEGAICGNPPGTPCDLEAATIENMTKAGVTVVAAAGNEGDLNQGGSGPAYDTIDTPGYTPSAIAVGGVTNSHFWENEVHLPGGDVPANLQDMAAQFSADGFLPVAPVIAPGIDVAKVGNDGFACSALRAGSLNGAIALVERGSPPAGPAGCTFLQKVQNAQNAGAAGVVIYDNVAGEAIFPPGGLSGTTIPAVLISNADGLNLKQFLDSHAGHLVTVDPTLYVAVSQQPDLIATFSSRGPATGTGAIKPELLAVGTDLYMATESSDPTGELYSPNGYTVQAGTSFSTPMVAGAVALVKQKHSGFTPAQLKSAVVNTANSTGVQDEYATPVHVQDMGAGMLDAAAAVASNIAIEPATLSFGIVKGSLPAALQLQITNTSSSSVNLTFSVNGLDPDTTAHVSLDKNGLSLTAGQTGVLTVSLKGTVPAAGIYDGFVNIQGGSSRLNVPYMYLVGDGVPANIVALLGDGNDGTVNQSVPDGEILFQVTDQFGVPVSGAPVTFSVVSGGGSIQQPDAKTDVNGIAGAGATYGSQPGNQVFQGQAGSLTVTFNDTARVLPVISPGRALNAADFKAGQAAAPGSYIALFGAGLSDDTNAASTAALPFAIDNVSVSFDVPGANLSLPGHLIYVSPSQVNVQVPWELAGQTSAIIKVNISETTGQTYTLPLATYSPAFFQFDLNGQLSLAARDANFNAITPGHPALRGQVVTLYANGLGPVTNQPASGDVAPSAPKSQTQSPPQVTIGGQPATVQFSGLTTGVTGLYQLDVMVPSGISPGMQPAIVTIGGVPSPASNLPVQ